MPRKPPTMTSTSISMPIPMMEILRAHAAAHDITLSKRVVDLMLAGLFALAEKPESGETEMT